MASRCPDHSVSSLSWPDYPSFSTSAFLIYQWSCDWRIFLRFSVLLNLLLSVLAIVVNFHSCSRMCPHVHTHTNPVLIYLAQNFG